MFLEDSKLSCCFSSKRQEITGKSSIERYFLSLVLRRMDRNTTRTMSEGDLGRLTHQTFIGTEPFVWWAFLS